MSAVNPKRGSWSALPHTPGWATIDSHWVPSHVVETAWLEHGAFASWLVGALKPRVIVELGTHNGYSYFAMCEAVVRRGLPTKTFAVDTWHGDDHAGFYGEEIYSLVNRVNDRDYAGFSTLLRGYFSDFVDTFDDGSIDLLHIDGRHGYEDAREDFESWLPKVSSRGVVIFHDITVHAAGFGVFQLWDELQTRYPSFTFEHGNGLGVLGVGAEFPEPITALFQADEPEAAAIRNHYELAGAQLSRLELDRARAELRAMRNSLAWKLTVPIRALFSLVPVALRRKLRPDPEHKRNRAR